MNMKKTLLLIISLLALGCQAQDKKSFDISKYKDVILNEYAYPRYAKSADDTVGPYYTIENCPVSIAMPLPVGIRLPPVPTAIPTMPPMPTCAAKSRFTRMPWATTVTSPPVKSMKPIPC